MGTAGLERYLVSGKRRAPRPPPSTTAITLFMVEPLTRARFAYQWRHEAKSPRQDPNKEWVTPRVFELHPTLVALPKYAKRTVALRHAETCRAPPSLEDLMILPVRRQRGKRVEWRKIDDAEAVMPVTRQPQVPRCLPIRFDMRRAGVGRLSFGR